MNLVAICTILLLQSESQERKRILIDCEPGFQMDDAWALALAISSREFDLQGITTSGEDPYTGGLIASRLLYLTGRRGVPVAAARGARESPDLGGQFQYGLRPAFGKRPVRESAPDFLQATLTKFPGEITILALGSPGTVPDFFAEHPDMRSFAKAVVTPHVGGDLSGDQLKQIFAADTMLTNQLRALYELSGNPGSLRKARAVADILALNVGGPDEFFQWYLSRVGSGNKCSLPVPGNVSRILSPQHMPRRVHVVEDFQTDRARRWWMCGKSELDNVPPGSLRSIRGVLTNDFDDVQGDRQAMYRAVIFNPVPGPPMGKETRLTFRYWLKGSSSLRIQIYSLSKGYHRYLSLSGLPQGVWQEATVDMTAARRPDQTGGPLSEGERIDDIQFYTDRDAELLIGELALYDQGTSGQYPRKVFYTAWFDTGRQGREWPGDFTIVPLPAPSRGRIARSVECTQSQLPWVRLDMGVDRPLPKRSRLRFRYHLSRGDLLKINGESVGSLRTDEWAEADIGLTTNRLRELSFVAPAGAVLQIQEALLYEPAE